MRKKRILVVEDERIVADDVKMSLQKLGYVVSGIAVSGKEAIKKAGEIHPDLVLMDIVLEGEMDGIEAASIMCSHFDIPVVYLTAHADDKTLERAKITDPFGYIIKPFEDKDVHSTIEMALYKHKIGKMLKESEERYRTLFEESRDAIYVTSRDGKVADFNQSMLDLFGYTREKMLGMDILRIYVNPLDWRKLQKQIEENGFVRNYEVNLCNKGGGEMDCLLTASVRHKSDESIWGYQGSIRDITERKRAEKELFEAKDEAERTLKELRKVQTRLVQSERLAAVGELSAGVTHEINNPLNIISGHTQMLLIEENLDSEVRESLEIIKMQVDRASSITEQLLKFSKGAKLEMKKVNVNEIVRNTLAFLERQLAVDNIKIVKRLSSEPVSVYADQSQLQQVFLNLILNASHAMPDRGTLAVSTRIKNANIEIDFTDTGCGISKENLNKLFEPFFSTKEKGAGLGLSIAHGIIEAHRGSIEVESEVGKGTTFTVTLPIEKRAFK